MTKFTNAVAGLVLLVTGIYYLWFTKELTIGLLLLIWSQLMIIENKQIDQENKQNEIRALFTLERINDDKRNDQL
jgi:hypothetical protein